MNISSPGAFLFFLCQMSVWLMEKIHSFNNYALLSFKNMATLSSVIQAATMWNIIAQNENCSCRSVPEWRNRYHSLICGENAFMANGNFNSECRSEQRVRKAISLLLWMIDSVFRLSTKESVHCFRWMFLFPSLYQQELSNVSLCHH